MYAIVKTGGKQYRVEEGQSLLIERLPVDDGGKAALTPLLYVDGDNVLDGEDLAKVSIEARVIAHERGPKLRVVKFKPKRGYKRRTGHRQELTRIEVTSIKLASRRPSGSGSSRRSAPKPVAAEDAEATRAAETTAGVEPTAAASAVEATPVEKPPRSRARKPAAEAKATAAEEAKPAAEEAKAEEDNGA
jgi:large subunit ribosomal protein L21